jgi:hypothetical protein
MSIEDPTKIKVEAGQETAQAESAPEKRAF